MSARTTSAAAKQKPARRWTARGIFETALIVIGLLANVALLPRILSGDGSDRYNALTQLLSGNGFSPTKYSLIGPLFAAPLWFIGKALGHPTVLIKEYNTIIFALGLLALYLLLRRHVEARLLRAFLLLLTVVSMVPNHLTQFYGEVFTAMLVVVGLTTLVLKRWGALGGIALLAVGVANTPAAIGGLALALGRYIWQTRRLRYALALVLAAGLIVGEWSLRRGSALNNGYQQDGGSPTLMPFSGIPGFSYPFLFGLLAILFSFGKGLVFFTPGLFLPVRRRIAEVWGDHSVIWTLYSLWLCFVAGLIMVYAKWWAWYGGWFWGPRFFLFACVPASFALALWIQRPSQRLWVNLLALLVLGLSTWVAFDGAVFNQANLSACMANNYFLEAYCHFTPDFSALWRPLVNAYKLGLGLRFAQTEQISRRAMAFGVYVLLVSAYLSLPLVRAIWSQSRAALRVWTPRVMGTLAGLRL